MTRAAALSSLLAYVFSITMNTATILQMTEVLTHAIRSYSQLWGK